MTPHERKRFAETVVEIVLHELYLVERPTDDPSYQPNAVVDCLGNPIPIYVDEIARHVVEEIFDELGKDDFEVRKIEQGEIVRRYARGRR